MTSEDVLLAEGTLLLDHAHDCPHMLVVISGCLREDGRRYTAGDIRLSEPDDRHFLRALTPVSCQVVELSGEGRPARLRRIVGTAGRNPDEAIRRWEDAGDAPDWLRELDSLCRRNSDFSALPVSRMARAAGVSREHLSRVHRRCSGISIAERVRYQRLHHAYDAIVGSSASLADIAGTCGFADQSHMTRLFVDWLGVTPGLVRRGQRHVTQVQDVRPPSWVT